MNTVVNENKAVANDFNSLLGVLDVVDELRVKTNNIEQYANKDELTKQVKEYYNKNGIAVSDELIEEAVAKKLGSRFDYKPYDKGFLTTLSNWYINRIKIASIATPLILAPLVLGYGGVYVNDKIQESGYNSTIASVSQTYQDAEGALKETQNIISLSALKMADIAKEKENAPSKIKAVISATEVGSEYQLAELSQTLKSVTERFSELKPTVVKKADLSNEVEIEAKLKEMTEAKSAVFGLLTSAQQFNQSLKVVDSIFVVGKKYNALMEEYSNKDYDDITRAFVNGYVLDVDSALTAKNIPMINQKIAEVERVITYVDSDITFKVNMDGKSGVERFNNEDTSIKNYYLIVNAFNASSNKIAAIFEDYETKQMVWSDTFGMNISKATYEEIKADKKAHGVITKNLVGYKKPGTIKFSYELIPQTSNFISKW